MAKRAGRVWSIDAYISRFPPGVRRILKRIRATIVAAAPDAQETISYRMPALKQTGMLVYFAGFKHHVGMFPPVKGDARLDGALARYRGPKGNLRFPLDEPIPYGLITRIVKLRVKQDRARSRGGRVKALSSHT